MKRRKWLIAALTLQAIAWIFVLGHRVSLNPGGQQIFFGLTIPFQASILLRIIEAMTIAISLSVIVKLGVRVFFDYVVHDKRLKQGVCKRCGYDIRGSTIQCPECGYVVERMTPAP